MRVTTTSFFLSFGLLVVTTASYAQSLADVARKEEERRKTQPQSAKVYTNKDLVEVPQTTMPAPAPAPGSASGTGGSATTTAPTTTSSSSTASSGAPGVKDDKGAGDAKDAPSQTRDRAYWSGRIKAAQDTLDRDATFADALQSRINALTTDFTNRDDPAQRATIGRDRDKATAELERLKKKVLEDRKAITDIEEDARRSGVPPGWLR